MAIWSRAVITNIGKQMIADCQANAKTLNITNCVLSSHNYYDDSLSTLTTLEDIKQTKAISEKYVENDDTVKVVANFDNSQLTTGYDLYTFGVYANSGSSDILLLVGVTDKPDAIPSLTDAPWQTIINAYIKIENAPDITITVNPAANATIGYVDTKVNEIVVRLNADETNITKNTTNITNIIKSIDGTNGTLPNVAVPITGWSSQGTYYTKVLTVSGLKTTNSPIISLVVNDTIDITTVKQNRKDYNNLFAYEVSNANKLTLYSYSIPTKAFTIALKGVGL